MRTRNCAVPGSRGRNVVACLLGALMPWVLLTGTARAQPAGPAIFVANNGNLEGSVTSLRVLPTGGMLFEQELVLGAGSGNPATNAAAISLTPDGRLLAISHTTAATVSERVSIVRVNTNYTMTSVGSFQVPDSPLDLLWLDNEHMAVTETRSTGINRVRVYRVTESPFSWSLIDTEDVGDFCSKLALGPRVNGVQYLFAQQSPLSGSGSISVFRIEADATLTSVGGISTGGTYPLGPGITPDGRFIYAAGGISANAILAYAVDGAGQLAPVPAMPFPTPDSSPKQCLASPDGRTLFVGHGTSSTIRSFRIDQDTGALTQTTALFDVGIQGALGDLAVMRIPERDILFATDRDFSTSGGNPRGVISFTINPDGTFTQASPIVDTQGISPTEVAVWPPLPPPPPPGPTCNDLDFNNDGLEQDPTDLEAFFGVYSGGPCVPAGALCDGLDFNNDGIEQDPTDLEAFFSVYSGGPCL